MNEEIPPFCIERTNIIDGRVKKLEKQMEKYDHIFVNFLVEKSQETPLDILKRYNQKYDNIPFKEWSPLDFIIYIWRFYDMQKREDYYFDDKFQKLMKDVENYLRYYEKKTGEGYKVFEEIKAKLRLLENTYSPETTVNLALDDTFQALKMDIKNLFEIKVEVSKWEFEIEGEDKEKALASRYRRIFEDDTLRLLLGEEDLQIVTKHDSFAYDIPLKLLRMALKIKSE